jgi:aspartyl-tRNA(Asn)/glutamyl-tRNA(Gln) amidotransferase subunit C
MTDVRELAGLARLELRDDEVEALGAQLDTILGYIRRLQAVDVSGVSEDEASPGRHGADAQRVGGGDAVDTAPAAEQVRSGLRDDRLQDDPAFDADGALAGVPELRGREVVVPRFKD